MNKLLAIILRKPFLFVVTSLVYLVLVGFLKWQVHPPLSAVWYLTGGVIGIYFLDAAEIFFALTPSPFRSVVFLVLFIVVSFFVVTSSGSLLASGLVLSLFLSILLWQLGEWEVSKNIDSWYRMVAGGVSRSIERWVLAGSIVLFLIETYFFTR